MWALWRGTNLPNYTASHILEDGELYTEVGHDETAVPYYKHQKLHVLS
jgi:hypothetical protein